MSPTGTPTRRRTARQQDLLGRLVTLMTSEGFSGFTLDDLAERLRCSKTSLYALAPSRHGLVVEVVKQYFRDAVPIVEQRVLDARTPQEQVVAYLTAVGDYLHPLSRAFTDDLSRNESAAALYRRNTEAAADRIRQMIADGIDAGVFRQVHAPFVGEMVAATMFEIQRGQMFERLELSDAEAYAELASLVIAALEV